MLIAGHIAQLRQLLQPGEHFRREGIQFIDVGVLQRVLKLRAAHAIFHGKILHRLHEKCNAGDLCQLRLQAANHVAGIDFSLLKRLEVDENAPAIQRCMVPSMPMNDDKFSTAGSCKMILVSCCCSLAISGKEMDCAASETP